ncbi:DUF3553 domain-containing protein [Hasllibacter sp. MH4015]|uniref:DUF3553 domain-containing protein n=1 Tax=Hasllibacter sp. MH4015 TaxID=2854029 RepID=UPI001CD47E5F|nr:DUF3553 domain-containing protein [Hasllibacter sp. MH4015]
MDKDNSAAADITAILEPGMYVRLPAAPDWGLGQVQSNIGGKVTVNFEHEGKVVLDGHKAALVIDDPS